VYSPQEATVFATESNAAASDLSIRVRDGRRLAAREYGDRTGTPVVFVPGYGFSRLTHMPGSLTPGVRVISLDLPRIGGSDPHPGYALRSWTNDVVDFLDALNIEHCAVLGWSWGAPYALACGYCLPQRVLRVGLAAALGGWLQGAGAATEVSREWKTFGWQARWFRPGLRLFFSAERRAFLRDPERSMARDAQHWPASDQRVAASPAVHTMFIEAQRETWRQGIEGMYEHGLAVALPWGFSVRDVLTDVRIWHGNADTEIPTSMVRRLAAELPSAKLEVFPEEGHLVVFEHWSEILRTLTATEPSRGR
jgi:pimeloyl-ACP methyl ester carboxylesterase